MRFFAAAGEVAHVRTARLGYEPLRESRASDARQALAIVVDHDDLELHRRPTGTLGTQIHNEAFARLAQRIRDQRNVEDLSILAHREARHARTEHRIVLVGDGCAVGGPPHDAGRFVQRPGAPDQHARTAVPLVDR